jgi:DNA repair protein RecO (recombination protein O)
MKRTIQHESAYVLHRYDWSESSLILETFTRHHGRIALVAKGAKRPSSNFRPVLLPLQPLQLSFGGDAEIRTLKAAEWAGGHVMPTGEALLSGYYVNELLIRLLARDDAHPALFDAYAGVVRVLATLHDQGAAPVQAMVQASALRAFELIVLREVGLLPALDAQTSTLAPLRSDAPYALVAEAGLREAGAGEAALGGADWVALQRRLDDAAPFTAALRAIAELTPGANAALRAQLRALLNYHCGVSTLRTRQIMREIKSIPHAASRLPLPVPEGGAPGGLAQPVPRVP